MKKYILPILLVIASFFVIVSIANAALLSSQVGSNPVNGYCLKTNGSTSTWSASCGGGSGSTTTFNQITTSTLTIACGSGCTVATSTDSSGQAIVTITTSAGNSSSTTLHAGNGWSVTALSGGNQTGSINDAYGNLWSVFQMFGAGENVSGTLSLASTTNAVLVVSPTGTVLAYAGSNVCSAGNYATAVSATGTITCTAGVSSVNGSTGAVTGVITTTTQITAGGTATGNIFTFATSTSAGKFNINGNGTTVTFTIPPQSDQFYAPSTTIPTNNNQLTNGSNFTTLSTSTANNWTALQTFLAGHAFNYATGTTATSTIYIGNVTTTNLYALNIYDEGVTSSPCLSDNGIGLIGSVNCVNFINNLTGSIIATGTANEIGVSSSTGQIVFSTPQAIGTASTPTFGGLIINGNTTTTSETVTGVLQDGQGNKYSTSTAASLAGYGHGVSGNQIVVSSTFASSTASIPLLATTSALYGEQELFTNTQKSVALISCYDGPGATTVTSSVIVWYNTTLASSGFQQTILPFLTCSVNGNTTTTFTTSTIPANAHVWFAVSSTNASTLSNVTVNLSATRQ